MLRTSFLTLIALSVAFLLMLPEVSSSAASRFVVSENVANDTQTGLCWTSSGNVAGKSMSWSDAHVFIERLNARRYSGHDDWRLPSKTEMDTLAEFFLGFSPASHKTEDRPAVLFARFGINDVQDYGYWTDSFYDMSHDSYRNIVWVISMYGGYISNINSNNKYYVWPVRSSRP